MKKILFSVFVVCICFTLLFSEDLKTPFEGFEGTELSVEEAHSYNGGETYIGYQHIALGKYHTFILVTDKSRERKDAKVRNVFESGPEYRNEKRLLISNGSKKPIFGKNVRQKYNYDYDTKEKKAELDKPTNIYQKVEPPKGMSSKKFDDKVIRVGQGHLKIRSSKYYIYGNSCNTSTSKILLKSGAKVKPIRSVPGWRTPKKQNRINRKYRIGNDRFINY